MAQLSKKQLKFIEAYNGNATEAARIAGYTGNDNVLGVTGLRLLRHPKIKAVIEAREKRQINSLIATREQRQEFWTRVMNDAGEDMRNRLKASELLGRANADFTENHNHSGTMSFVEIIEKANKNE